MDDQVSRRAAFGASVALLCFGALTAFALAGWVHQWGVLWTWKSVLALGCVALALTTSALMWCTPTRTHTMMGIAVMLLSLVRIGPPVEWTWQSFALVAITFLLLMPLVYAAIVLRDELE